MPYTTFAVGLTLYYLFLESTFLLYVHTIFSSNAIQLKINIFFLIVRNNLPITCRMIESNLHNTMVR